MATEEQHEPGAVEPVPGRPLVAAEQVGGAPTVVERLAQPSTFDQLTRIALDLRPTVRRHALRAFSREDGADTIRNLGREILVGLLARDGNRHRIVGWLCDRQQGDDLGFVLPQPARRLSGSGSGADSRSVAPSSRTAPPARTTSCTRASAAVVI